MRSAGTPTCPIHPQVSLRCPACTGAQGGKRLTPKKLRHLKRIARLPRPRDTKGTP
jgi:hypothetical protein